MRVCIMQPAYLPWLGYFDRIARCDAVVFWDHVVFSDKHKDNFVNRNKIRTAQGWQWLTVPVHDASNTPIWRVKAVNISWDQKHRKSITNAYPGMSWDWLDLTLGAPIRPSNLSLGRICDDTCYLIRDYLGLAPWKIAFSRDYALPIGKNEALIAMCQYLGATEYLSGPQGRRYLDLSQWEQAGIKVEFHDYEHPTYRQRYEPFIPYMSIIDLIYNEGPRSLEILTHGDFGPGRASG